MYPSVLSSIPYLLSLPPLGKGDYITAALLGQALIQSKGSNDSLGEGSTMGILQMSGQMLLSSEKYTWLQGLGHRQVWHER